MPQLPGRGDAFQFYGKLKGLSSFPDILQAIASEFGISSNGSSSTSSTAKPKTKIVAVYDYHDEAGKVLYGFKESEALGKVSRELLRTIHLLPWPEITQRLRERAFWEGELRHKHRDGHEITVLSRMQLIAGDDGIERILEINRDITARWQAEEALREAKDTLEQRVRERTTDLQRLTEQLEKSRAELRMLASELVMAEERERKRVAGVLHDDIAQILAAARMRLDLLLSIPSDQKDKQTLQEVKNFLVQSIQETRALMNDLGNPLLFDLELKSACESLANRLMEGHPTRIICDIRDEHKHLDPDMKVMLFQVIRELLNNVMKHSKAQNAHVLIDLENGHFRVRVKDDGVGFDTGTLGAPTVEGGFGLYSIRERLIAVDGTLSIESTPGAGTVVTAILPAEML